MLPIRTIFPSLLLVLFCLTKSDGAQVDTLQTDTMHVIIETPFTVIGTRATRSSDDFPFEKEQFARVLEANGFDLVNRGVFFAQDLHVDGFKRGDITIVVDGERYHSACPNRMDSPLARTNAFEMASIDMTKTSASVSSGLGGAVTYHREIPGRPTLVRAGLSGSLDASEAGDFAFAATSHQHRLSGRYASGKGYEDGDGGTFVERYGYRENYDYTLAEASVAGRTGDWQYRTEFTYTENVMFPYLQMDERTNRVFSASAGWRDHKAYLNYTDHLMDGHLRVSTMSMVTDATNLTVGLTGTFYDIYYRHWNADNEIVTPMVRIENHLMPDVRLLAGSLYHRRRFGSLIAWGKIGLAQHTIDDTKRVDFYQVIHPEASDSRTHPILALGGLHRYGLSGKWSGSIAADLAMEPPPSEYLYIAVQRPGTNPWWSGNPTLKAPLRLSLRTNFGTRGLNFEAFTNRVWSYANLVGVMAEGRTYRSYENVDALMAGFSFTGRWQYADVSAGYTWAENLSDDRPLVEIPPLAITYTFKSPEAYGFKAWGRQSWNDAQTRIDETLSEEATASWNRVDIGLSYTWRDLRFGLEITNLRDELYYQHLSYLRNPYSSGFRVYEPGRTIRVNIVFDGSLGF